MLREVFWDTNSYRELGIVAIEKGQPAFHKLLKDILNAEEEKEIKVKISYLVLCEMFSHLADDSSSRVYKQCKFGLYALLKHCRSNPDNLLRSFEHEMIYFFSGNENPDTRLKETNLFSFLVTFEERSFDDLIISLNRDTARSIHEYLDTEKNNWIDTLLNQFVTHHDPEAGGEFIIFKNDAIQRSKLLRKLRAAKKNNEYYFQNVLGMKKYLMRNFPDVPLYESNEDNIKKAILRFLPLFDLQYLMLEKFCQTKYDLRTKKRYNDIIDFLIAADIKIDETLFVSKETNKMVPAFHALGYEADVRSLKSYLEFLNVDWIL